MSLSQLISHIYINGRRYQIVGGFEASFYADAPDLPGRPCSQHNIGPDACAALLSGTSVRTLGNVYSLHGPEWIAFTLDGVEGRVYANNWLSWSTLNCDTGCTFSPELRAIVDRLSAELKERAKGLI